MEKLVKTLMMTFTRFVRFLRSVDLTLDKTSQITHLFFSTRMRRRRGEAGAGL